MVALVHLSIEEPDLLRNDDGIKYLALLEFTNMLADENT